MKKIVSAILVIVILSMMASMVSAAATTVTLQDYSGASEVSSLIAKGWDDPKVDLSKVSLDAGRIKVDTNIPEPNIVYLFPVTDLSGAQYVEFNYKGFGTEMEPPADNNSYTIGLAAKNPDTGAMEIVDVSPDAAILMKDAGDSKFAENKTGPGHSWGWISKNFDGVIRIPLSKVPLTEVQKANVVGLHWVIGGDTKEKGKFFYVDNIKAGSESASNEATTKASGKTSSNASGANPKTGDTGILAMLLPLAGSAAALATLRKRKSH